MKQFWNKILAGFVIGAGAILPGLSGGILAVSMGLYQPAIEAVTGFFKNPKKNLKFLLPLAIGGIIGFLIFMLIINRFFADYETEIICLFVGLVIGSVSSFLNSLISARQKLSLFTACSLSKSPSGSFVSE